MVELQTDTVGHEITLIDKSQPVALEKGISDPPHPYLLNHISRFDALDFIETDKKAEHLAAIQALLKEGQHFAVVRVCEALSEAPLVTASVLIEAHQNLVAQQGKFCSQTWNTLMMPWVAIDYRELLEQLERMPVNTSLGGTASDLREAFLRVGQGKINNTGRAFIIAVSINKNLLHSANPAIEAMLELKEYSWRSLNDQQQRLPLPKGFQGADATCLRLIASIVREDLPIYRIACTSQDQICASRSLPVEHYVSTDYSFTGAYSGRMINTDSYDGLKDVMTEIARVQSQNESSSTRELIMLERELIAQLVSEEPQVDQIIAIFTRLLQLSSNQEECLSLYRGLGISPENDGIPVGRLSEVALRLGMQVEKADYSDLVLSSNDGTELAQILSNISIRLARNWRQSYGPYWLEQRLRDLEPRDLEPKCTSSS